MMIEFIIETEKTFREVKIMKAIIVYYSMSGNVKQTAERIAAETGADMLALHPVKAYPDKGAKKFFWDFFVSPKR